MRTASGGTPALAASADAGSDNLSTRAPCSSNTTPHTHAGMRTLPSLRGERMRGESCDARRVEARWKEKGRRAHMRALVGNTESPIFSLLRPPPFQVCNIGDQLSLRVSALLRVDVILGRPSSAPISDQLLGHPSRRLRLTCGRRPGWCGAARPR